MLIVDNATLVKRFFLVLIVSALLYVLGFAYFSYRANHISSDNIPQDGRHLVVVFTGGHGRIKSGFELAKKLNTTLLISGVHEESPLIDILTSNDIDPKAAEGLDIVLGRIAHNTYGNAIEADICATARGFDSIIVVTSNYHLLRAEIMMDIITNHSVYYVAETSKQMTLLSYLKNTSDFVTVLREYNKYLRLKLYYILHHYFKLFKINDGTHEYFQKL